LFVVFPVMVNTILMLTAAWLLNNALPGRRYPARSRTRQEDSDGWAKLGYGLSGEDLRSAVSSLEEFVDVSEEQLTRLYKATVVQMRKRQLGEIRCEQIMSRDVVSVYEHTPLLQAWGELQNRSIKALPVVDQQNRLVGIITQTDLAKVFMEKLSQSSNTESVEQKLYQLQQTQQSQQTPVGLLMTTPVTAVNADSHIVDALPLFVERKIHHLPVVERNRVVVGMLTRTDLLALLQQNQTPP
jgi:CBS domain-containing membrane protein